jgi:hypothetical protein
MAELTTDAQALTEAPTSFDRVSSERKGAIGQVDSTAVIDERDLFESRTYVTLLSDQTGLNPSNDASGDVVDFKAMEETASGISGELKSAIASVDSTAGDRQLQSFVVEFDRPVDPVLSEDVFDFKAMEGGEAAGQVGTVKYDDIKLTEGLSLDGDGIDDVATYQPDTDAGIILVNIGYTDVNLGGIPVSMGEYGLLL